jgi:hypothetical protein
MMGKLAQVARWHLWLVLLAVVGEALWGLQQGPEHPGKPPWGMLLLALLLGGGALVQLTRAWGAGGAGTGLPPALLVRPCIALLFACPGLVTKRLIPESWYCLVALQLLAPLPHRLNLPAQIFQVGCCARLRCAGLLRLRCTGLRCNGMPLSCTGLPRWAAALVGMANLAAALSITGALRSSLHPRPAPLTSPASLSPLPPLQAVICTLCQTMVSGPQHSLWHALHNCALAALAALVWRSWEAHQRAVFAARRR